MSIPAILAAAVLVATGVATYATLSNGGRRANPVDIGSMSPRARKLLARMALSRPVVSPDIPFDGAPPEARELERLGYLKHVADRYEVSAKAWIDMGESMYTREDQDELRRHLTEDVAEPGRIRVRGLTKAQADWSHQALAEVSYEPLEHDPQETMLFGGTYIEGTAEELGIAERNLEQLADMIREDPDQYLSSIQMGDDMPDWMRERAIEATALACESAASKIRATLNGEPIVKRTSVRKHRRR